jgi:hypothetical protein
MKKLTKIAIVVDMVLSLSIVMVLFFAVTKSETFLLLLASGLLLLDLICAIKFSKRILGR